MKKITTLIILALCSIIYLYGATSYTLTGSGDNLTLTITGTGEMPDYSPENLPPWYSERDNINTLIIESGITYIGNYAFSDCTGLTSLTIPNSVTSVGSYAFSDCSGLKDIVLEDGAEYLFFGADFSESTNVFENCPIESLHLGRDITTSWLDSPFQDKQTLTSLTISSSVTELGGNAFRNCTGLKGTLTIPGSVRTIDFSAFEGCTGLTGTLTIPNTVTDIRSYAFSNCTGLTGTLTIPNSITTISNSVFEGCENLTSLIIDDSVTSIMWNAFAGCKGLTGALTIPNSVTSIGNSAFDGCKNLTSLTIGTSVVFIGHYAFRNCTGLIGSLIIPNSVINIGWEAFSDCEDLTSLTIGTSVASIGDCAFDGCDKLMEINCKNPTPPEVSNSTFENVDYATCVLYVPIGSITAYSSHPVWGKFLNIEEKDFSSSIQGVEGNNDVSATITSEGLHINGCNMSDRVSIYTISGVLLHSSLVGDGFISYPFSKGTYIITTPKGALKAINY